MRNLFLNTVLIVALAAIIAFPFALAYGLNVWSCYRKSTVMEMDWQYGFGIGCMVKTSAGRWFPLKSIRDITP
jgi:hypothetical protein